MSESYSLAHAKAHLSDLVDRVKRTHERVTITRHGHPDAVLVSPDDLSALEETLDLLGDPAAMQELEQAREDAAQGRWIDAEQLRQRYLKQP